MGNRLADKRVLFVGAATGIGRETVRHFADEGATLVIVDTNEAEGRTVADGIGATFIACDISQEDRVRDMVASAAETMGGLDVLVNNAAIHFSGAVTGFEVADWDRIYSVNVRGMFLSCKHAVPHLRKSQAASIINTASLAGFRGLGGMTAYSSTKGAVIAFTSALAVELGGDRIRVNAICPGWVDTPFNDPAIRHLGGKDIQQRMIAAAVPLGRQGVPDDIAPLFFYLASDESRFMSAQAIVIDGGAYN